MLPVTNLTPYLQKPKHPRGKRRRAFVSQERGLRNTSSCTLSCPIRMSENIQLALFPAPLSAPSSASTPPAPSGSPLPQTNFLVKPGAHLPRTNHLQRGRCSFLQWRPVDCDLVPLPPVLRTVTPVFQVPGLQRQIRLRQSRIVVNDRRTGACQTANANYILDKPRCLRRLLRCGASQPAEEALAPQIITRARQRPLASTLHYV